MKDKFREHGLHPCDWTERVRGQIKGSQLLDYVADHCGYLGAEKAARKLKTTVSKPNRIRSLYGSSVEIKTRSFDITKLKTAELEKLINDAMQANDKAAIKHLDALLYGPELWRTGQYN